MADLDDVVAAVSKAAKSAGLSCDARETLVSFIVKNSEGPEPPMGYAQRVLQVSHAAICEVKKGSEATFAASLIDSLQFARIDMLKEEAMQRDQAISEARDNLQKAAEEASRHAEEIAKRDAEIEALKLRVAAETPTES